MSSSKLLADRLQTVADQDVNELLVKDKEYGSSWMKRGGTGAFHNLDRKWSRIEKQCEDHGWDLFAAIKTDPRPEGILDDLGDLARYIMLVRAEHMTWVNSERVEYTGQDHPYGYDAEDEA